MSAQIEMNMPTIETPVVESQESKQKQKHYISKREGFDHLVFGYWFIHQVELDEVSKAKVMQKLRLLDGHDVQKEFMDCFNDDYKIIEKEVIKNINNHHKPVKEKKEKKLSDAPKAKRGRPKVEKPDNRSDEEKLIDQIIKAAQTEPAEIAIEKPIVVESQNDNSDPTSEKSEQEPKKKTTPTRPKKTKKKEFVEPPAPVSLNAEFELQEESYNDTDIINSK